MANVLGIPEYDPSLDRLNMQLQSQAIQQLGQQVRQDIQQIQTNRQLKGFSEGLQGLNTQSPDFGRGVVGLMTQYPLAAHSPIGQAAINTLGAEHKAWQAQEAKNNWRMSGGTLYSPETGDYKNVPGAGSGGRPVVVKTANGAVLVDPRSGDAINQFGDPFPAELPAKPGTVRMGADGTLYNSTDGGIVRGPTKTQNVPASPQEKAVSQALTAATIEAGKAEADAARFQNLYDQLPDDDFPSAVNPERKNRDLKNSSGQNANAMRAKAAQLKRKVEELSTQLKSFRPDPVIPGLTPTDVGSVNPEALIPAIPATAPKVFGTYSRDGVFRENVQAR